MDTHTDTTQLEATASSASTVQHGNSYRNLKGFADLDLDLMEEVEVEDESEEQRALLRELIGGGPSPLVQPACLREDSSSSVTLLGGSPVNDYFTSRGIPMSPASNMIMSPAATLLTILPSPLSHPACLREDSSSSVNGHFASRGIPICSLDPPVHFFVPIAGHVVDPHMYVRSSTCPALLGENTNMGAAMTNNVRAASNLFTTPPSPAVTEQMQLQAMYLAAQHSGHVSAAPPQLPAGYLAPG
ncbi:hypothetical protein T484DRAFT_3166021 [Baffinella frigidus]|nr:hypothetical protein T484DRAFT_3166021 [Cryptophyta sp. CCMP2293]|eukprot:CAMPEP_0180127350 /NCGR_PEP_ID=MMETSP0986-20121125/6181_1 /TAXON_ID=697907 /ORGANISM="non described non described, Strain CCMP2293" /LENGTH=243 /DNA_ID=CAMNT_0022066837 /DNA_START=43 /DNA_END=774 /DNA_ORIENTATION=+